MVSQRLPKDCPKIAQSVLDIIREKPEITISELSASLLISERTVKGRLALLKKAVLLKGWEVGHQVIGKSSNDFLNATGNAMTDQPTYEALLAEVKRLRAENAELKKRLGIPDTPPKRQLSGPERIALFMSLFSGRQDVYAHRWESKNGQKGYTPTYVNEWHHVSAVSFERVMKHVNAKYVYRLTATPTRNDGQQPIIFMQCGPIRYTADAKQQIASQDFECVLMPRFTSQNQTKLRRFSSSSQ